MEAKDTILTWLSAPSKPLASILIRQKAPVVKPRLRKCPELNGKWVCTASEKGIHAVGVDQSMTRAYWAWVLNAHKAGEL